MKRPDVEPRVVTGLWLADSMNKCLERAESCPVMVSSLGGLLPGSAKWKKYQDRLVKQAIGYMRRLKRLVEPKTRAKGGEQDGCRTRKDRRGLARLGGRLMTTPCHHPKQRKSGKA